MIRSLTRIALAAALLVAGCSLGEPATGGPTITVEIEVPSTIDWRRTVEGVEVAGSGTQPDQTELTMLAGALAEMPSELLARAGLRTIYRIVSDPAAAEGEALAFARGPDIYLTDGTFARVAGRLELAEVLAHELAHTAQFAELRETDLELLVTFDGVEVYSVTSFVGEFARDVGWVNIGSDESPTWRLDDPSGTTPYGASAPAEDMADTISRLVAGRAAGLSRTRVTWTEEFLSTSARTLAKGKPYLPDGAAEVAPPTPLYDEARAARLIPGVREVRSWALPAASEPTESLARQIQDELGRRGISGSLRRAADDAVARYSGEFVRADGLRFLVELWDFRDAPGYVDPPPQPVLTYVSGS